MELETLEKSIDNRKLSKLLSAFSSLEWKRFARFLRSPYHNTNPEVVTLLDWLKKNKLNFDSPNLTTANIYKRLFGKGAVNEDRLQEVFSKMSKLAEDFLIQEHLWSNRQDQKSLLIKVLQDRNYDLFKRESLQLIGELNDKEAYKTEADYLLLHQVQHHLWYHKETEKFTQQQITLNQSQADLDNYYQLQKLQFLAALAGRAKFLNTETETLLNQLRTHLLAEDSIEEQEYKLLYKQVCQLHLTGTATEYFAYKAKLTAVFRFLSKEHKINLLIHLVNFIINYRLSKSDLGEKDIFELYQLGVAENLFMEQGHIRDIEFTNICIAGFHIKETAWTEKFIEDYQSFLLAETREFLIPFVKAYGQFFAGRFEAVISLLRTVQPDHQLKYYCRIKSLLIRAYFECVLHQEGKYARSLPYELDAFKKLMDRNKKNTAIRTKAYLNFIFIVKKMIPMLPPQTISKVEIGKVKKLIVTKKVLIFKKWLIDKVKELDEICP